MRDAIQGVQELLVALEVGCCAESINDLFRRIHSIKSNLRMVGFDDLAEYIHHFEDLLDILREGRLSFTDTLSDVHRGIQFVPKWVDTLNAVIRRSLRSYGGSP